MHLFHYKAKELYCEDVSVRKIAKKVGTPFYCYSIGTFIDHYQKLRHAFSQLDPIICFSVKANSNLSVLNALVRSGTGLDIVSGGELFRAKKVGADPRKIVYASVGKTEAEIEAAICYGILMFNVESIQELDVINTVACKLKTTQKVAIRVNPDVEADTHHYIKTGTKENKFGLDIDTVYKLFIESYRYPFLRFAGIHMHIGSQIIRTRPFVRAIRKCLQLIDSVSYAGSPVEYLNIGGGMGITYSKEKAMPAKQFAKAILPLFKAHAGLKVILEPGRFVSGNSGILVTKVLYEKLGSSKSFIIVDAGMNDLIRPSFYGAYHEIVPLIKPKRKEPLIKVDVVGPICESSDFFAKERRLPRLKTGELLAVMSGGAYGFVMSSNYNSRPRVPEVVVRGSRYYVARRREIFDDLIRLERVVKEVL